MKDKREEILNEALMIAGAVSIIMMQSDRERIYKAMSTYAELIGKEKDEEIEKLYSHQG